MNQLDLLYRAFAEYRKITTGNPEGARSRKAIASANADADKIESTRSLCKIDEEWVAKIEQGLVYVEKAVREERQFIRTEGEVVPIEKAKRVSRASVSHLARHANLITRMQEGEDIIPEKLYIVEKLSDYAVYENRFLYMLLCYLRDFINMRLEKITELGNTYKGKFHIKKDVTFGKRRIRCETDFSEVSRNDPYAFFDKDSLPLIRRIESSQHIVSSLLNTPLMEQVSKTPMIKPPITKTNVLKMNVNFKAAVSLYEYVAAYVGDGYTIEEVKKTIDPFPENIADEVAEIVTLASFLTYEYGNGIAAELKKTYDKEELRRKEAEEQAFRERLKSLERRVHESGKGLSEYALDLERRNRELETYSEKLREARAEVEIANNRLEESERAVSELKDKELALRGEITELGETIAVRDAEIESLKVRVEEEIKLERARLQDEEARAKAALEEEKRQYAAECDVKTREALDALAKSENERLLTAAQLNGLRQQHGLIKPTDDYSSKERFIELEKQYNAFCELFDTQWKGAKKNIRKQLLWNKDKGREKNKKE